MVSSGVEAGELALSFCLYGLSRSNAALVEFGTASGSGKRVLSIGTIIYGENIPTSHGRRQLFGRSQF